MKTERASEPRPSEGARRTPPARSFTPPTLTRRGELPRITTAFGGTFNP